MLTLAALVLSSIPLHAAPPIDTVEHALRGEPVALLPRGLTSFGAEALDGWLYVFGGYHGEPHRYTKEGQSDDFFRLNLRDPRQVELLDGGVAIQGSPLCAWKGKLVRVGGMIAHNTASAPADLHSTTDAAIYDPTTRAWVSLPALPQARSSHDIEIVGDRLVVLGGWTLAGTADKSFRTTAALLDLARVDAGWKSIEAPFTRRALSAARVGARIAVIGGMNADGDVQPTVDLFDPASGVWSKGPDFPGSAFGVAACAVDDGVLASGKDGVVWRLDSAATAWSRAGTLAFPRFFHQLVAGEHHDVFVLGGIDDMRKDGRVRHIERLDPRRVGEALVSVSEIPAPFIAKNRQGAFLRGNALTLFGGNRSLKQHDFKAEDFRAEAWTLDLATLAWSTRAAFPEGRQTVASAIVENGDVGLAVGGFGFAEGRALARGTGYRYSFASDAWQHAANIDLPSPRTQFGLVENAGNMWVFGGLDYDAGRGDDAFEHPLEVLTLELSNSDARFSDSGVRLTMPRRAFACAVADGRAYLVGGMREEFDVVEDCESFDFETRSFTKIASPKRARVSAELVALEGQLYLCGGSSQGSDGKLAPDRSIECFDPKSGAWTTVVESLPIALPHVRAFALRDRLLLVSSHVDGPPTTRIVVVAP